MEKPDLEYRINAIEVRLVVGVWRGPKLLNQFTPDRPLIVFAKDDEEPLPYGRSLEELLAMNDLEIFDRRNDPEEVDNLALDPKRNGDLIVALNQETNRRIAEEVGEDDGRFLPIRDGKWHFPPASDR